MIRFRVGATSHTGRVRDHNEDAFLSSARMVIVADGMGGHAAGEVASRLAVEHLQQTAARPTELLAEALAPIIVQASDAILHSAQQNPERLGMGTTVCGIAVVSAGGSDHWALFNVGDSRVYRYAEGRLSQISTDHSEVAELVAAGRLSPQEAASYPRRNVVTRSLGTDPAPQPDVWVMPPTAGERFLLCSDGLTNELADASIAEVLAATADPQRATDTLVRHAVEAGGRDNVTVAVIDLLPDDRDDPEGSDTAPRPRDTGVSSGQDTGWAQEPGSHTRAQP